MSEKRDPERVVREIKRKTRRKFSAEEKIRIVLEGLRGEESIAGLCRGLCLVLWRASYCGVTLRRLLRRLSGGGAVRPPALKFCSYVAVRARLIT